MKAINQNQIDTIINSILLNETTYGLVNFIAKNTDALVERIWESADHHSTHKYVFIVCPESYPDLASWEKLKPVLDNPQNFVIFEDVAQGNPTFQNLFIAHLHDRFPNKEKKVASIIMVSDEESYKTMNSALMTRTLMLQYEPENTLDNINTTQFKR